MTAQAKLADLPATPATASARSGRPVVLQVLPSLDTGGVERGTIDIAAAIVKSGGTAIVVSSGGVMVRELERTGATHIAMPVHSKNPLVMWQNVSRLVRLIEKYDVDIVHARSRAPAWSAYYAAKRTNRAFVTTFHGTYSYANIFKRAYNRIMLRGDRVIAISHFIADHIRDVYGVEGPQIRVIHRGIDLDLFSPHAVTPERLIGLA